MKHWKDYKKLWINIGVSLLLGILLCIPVFSTIAQSLDDLNTKIGEKNTDIERLEREIKAYQEEINNLGKQKNSLSALIKGLDLTKKKLNADIAITGNKIDKTNFKIIELSLDIKGKENIINNNVNALGESMRRINEFDNNDMVATILSEDDFTLMWNDIDNMASMSKILRENTKILHNAKVGLEDTRDETKLAKEELERLKVSLADQKKIIEQNTKEKQKLLSQTKNSESSYQKLLKDRLATKVALEREVEEYESQIKYILNPKLLPSKGVLSWPLDTIYITQQFGVTKDSKRLYASGSHSGTDFRAIVGTPVKSVADGIVLGVGDTDLSCPYASLGKFVFIKHNNGLSSAYGHLSLIKVYQGQKIGRGEIIGYSGNTGHSTGPHLHLTVYAGDAAMMTTRPSKACPGRTYTMPLAPTSAYLDPLYYLPSL